LSNGTTTVTIEKVSASSANNSSWVARSYRINSFITPSANMHVIVEARDYSPGHLVEAGFDQFYITDSSILGTQSNLVTSESMQVFPNPFNGTTTVNYSMTEEQAASAFMEVVDVTGRVVAVNSIQNANGTFTFGSDLAEGVYVVRLVCADGIIDQQRVIKTK
jgi:hypothetical protein